MFFFSPSEDGYPWPPSFVSTSEVLEVRVCGVLVGISTGVAQEEVGVCWPMGWDRKSKGKWVGESVEEVRQAPVSVPRRALPSNPPRHPQDTA